MSYQPIGIFRATSSVEPCNQLFDVLESQRHYTVIYTHLDPNYPKAARLGGTVVILSDLKSAKFVLHYAHTAYKDMVRVGRWDEVLQKTPGKSSFVAGTTSVATQQQHLTFINQALETFNQLLLQRPSHQHRQLNGLGSPEPTSSTAGVKTTCSRTTPSPMTRIVLSSAKHSTPIEPSSNTFPLIPAQSLRKATKGSLTVLPTSGMRTFGNNSCWIPDSSPSDGQPNQGAPPHAHSIIVNLGQIHPSTTSSSSQGLVTISEGPSLLIDPTADKATQKIQLYQLMQQCQRAIGQL
eukprot:jgi/Psemu1/282722/fgenesh1_pg.12_\